MAKPAPYNPHMEHSGSSSASKFVVLAVLAVVAAGFGLILYQSVREMGGYDWAFEAAKPSSPGGRFGNGIDPTKIDVSISPSSSAPEQPVASPTETEAGEWTLRYCDSGGTHINPPEPFPQEIALLVHGLDDPGWTWNDMIDGLVAAGLNVARFDYPNDQAVPLSADMLADALEHLKTFGAERVNIVAHSMGGLVARDTLTRTEHYNGDGIGSDALPPIGRLIMIGTPHKGSQFARLRGVSELGEHLSRAWSGERDLFAFLDDGEGQAGFDLIPASDFLTELNKRPLAKNVKYTIIAGRVSPLEEGEVGGLVDRVDKMVPREKLPKWMRDRLDKLDRNKIKESLGKLVGGVGDGVVSLESAVLAGIDDVEIVGADHMTMIVDVLGVGVKPPAIPIVIERLTGSDDASDADDESDAGDTSDADSHDI